MNFSLLIVIVLVLFCSSGTAVIGYLTYDVLKQPNDVASAPVVADSASNEHASVDSTKAPEGTASTSAIAPAIFVKISNFTLQDNTVFESLSTRYAGVDDIGSCQSKCEAAGVDCIGFTHDRVNSICSLVQPGDGNPNDSMHVRLPDSTYVHLQGTGPYNINTAALSTVDGIDTLEQCLAVCDASQSLCSGVYYNETYNLMSSPIVKVKTCKQFRFVPSSTTDIYIKKRQTK